MFLRWVAGSYAVSGGGDFCWEGAVGRVILINLIILIILISRIRGGNYKNYGGYATII